MNGPILFCLSVLTFAGCAAEPSRVAGAPHSIATNPRMPLSDMEAFIEPEEWHRLRDLEYVRYAMMPAIIKADGSVNVGEETECYADSSWNQVARSLGKDVTLRTNATVSMLNKRGEITVVFFKSEIRGNLVLIFGRQIDEPPFPFAGVARCSAGDKSARPASRRPIALNTYARLFTIEARTCGSPSDPTRESLNQRPNDSTVTLDL